MELKAVQKLALVVTSVLVTANCYANLNLNLGTVFSGTNTPPANPNTPWVTVSFANQGTNVLFTLTGTQNLTDPENVVGFYFNFNDSLNLADLQFSLVSTSGLFLLPSITLDQNSLKADGDGKYDVQLDFTSGGNTNQTFGAGDSIAYLITYAGNGAITDGSFNYLSNPAGGSGPFYAAAHIQNTQCGESAWVSATTADIVPVPEPSTMALTGLLSVAAFIGRAGWRNFLKRNSAQ